MLKRDAITLFATGNVDSASAPTLCRLMRDVVVDAACGRDHTLALTSAGGLFAWGCNKDGRLGLGHTQTLYEPNMYCRSLVIVCLMPLFIIMHRIPSQGLAATSVAAGWDHSGAIIGGRVYMWGRGVKGQLGDGEAQSKKQVLDNLTLKSSRCNTFAAFSCYIFRRDDAGVREREMWQARLLTCLP